MYFWAANLQIGGVINVNWGDGQSSTIPITMGGMSLGHAYSDDGHYGMSATADGEEGQMTGGVEFDVVNEAPVATVASHFDEATERFVVNVTSFNDPSPADLVAGIHFAFASEYESLPESWAAASNATSAAFNPDNITEGQMPVWVRVYDTAGMDGGYRDYSTTLKLADLSAATVSASQNRLTWQDVSPQSTGYRIQRSTDGQNFSIYRNLARSELTFSNGLITWNDESLPEGTRYWYRIRATDDSGNGNETGYAPKKAVTTRLKGPSAFDGWAFSSTQLQFAWHNESQVATDVEIDLTRYDGTPVGTYMCSAFAELFVVSNLSEGTTYRATIHAFNAYSTSASSSELTRTTAGRTYTNSGGLEFMPEAVSATSSPGNVFIPTIGDGTKSVSITNMTNHVILDGNVTVTGYTLTQPVGDEDSFSVMVGGNLVGTYTFTHDNPMAAGFTQHFRFDHEAANTTVEVVAEDMEPEERWFIDAMVVNAVQPPLDIGLESGAVVVPSTVNNGKRHWVGVKEANGKVHIKATVDAATVTEDEAKRNIAWDNADQDGNDPLKATVDKSTPRHVEINARVGKAIAKADAWVVWADVSGNPPQKLQNQPVMVSAVRQGVTIGFSRQTTFTIHPAELFDLTKDVPALNGPNLRPDIPGFGPAGGALAAGVNARWDCTRRITIRAGTDIGGGFNLPNDPFTDYPAEDWLGNDDDSVVGEDNNPYDEPNRGKLSQEDVVFRQGPGTMAMQGGNPGNFYTTKLWFEDFCRLQLGPDGSAQWYRISDFSPWRVEFHFRKVAVKESDWNVDTNNDHAVTDRVIMESDPYWGQGGRDFNGDGDTNDPLAVWDEDPDFGSFGQNDNVGLPQVGQ